MVQRAVLLLCIAALDIAEAAGSEMGSEDEDEFDDEEDDGLSHRVDGTVVSAQSPTPICCANTAQLLAVDR